MEFLKVIKKEIVIRMSREFWELQRILGDSAHGQDLSPGQPPQLCQQVIVSFSQLSQNLSNLLKMEELVRARNEIHTPIYVDWEELGRPLSLSG